MGKDSAWREDVINGGIKIEAGVTRMTVGRKLGLGINSFDFQFHESLS